MKKIICSKNVFQLLKEINGTGMSKKNLHSVLNRKVTLQYSIHKIYSFAIIDNTLINIIIKSII